MIALLLVLGQTLDVPIEVRLPIPVCAPEVVGVNGMPPTSPEWSPLVLYRPGESVRFVVASTCHYPRWICLNYTVDCTANCVQYFGPYRTPGKEEWPIDISGVLVASADCWEAAGPYRCFITYYATSLGDMNGDCKTDSVDVRLIGQSQAWNRLQIFALIQNDWFIAPPWGERGPTSTPGP